jgi:transcriptional regulator with XRE-family HTH domain
MMQSVSKWVASNNLSRKQFGDMLGITRAHASHVILGSRRPSVELLRKIHEVTDIPVEKLLYECT